MANLFSVNHAEAGGSFEPLPIQEYELVISEVKLGVSKGEKTAGCQQIELVMTVRDDIDQPGKKRKFFDTIIFAPSLAWKVQQYYKALFENGASFSGPEEVARASAYKCIRIKNKHEVQSQGAGAGKVRDKVDAYLPSQSPLAGGGAGMGGFDPFNSAGGGGGAGPMGTEPNSHDDDDVPF